MVTILYQFSYFCIIYTKKEADEVERKIKKGYIFNTFMGSRKKAHVMGYLFSLSCSVDVSQFNV